jgi:hypothetical protein
LPELIKNAPSINYSYYAGISSVKTVAKNVSNDSYNIPTAVAAVEKPVPYISSPGVKMFHPAQQHSYIAHIYETCADENGH